MGDGLAIRHSAAPSVCGFCDDHLGLHSAGVGTGAKQHHHSGCLLDSFVCCDRCAGTIILSSMLQASSDSKRQ